MKKNAIILFLTLFLLSICKINSAYVLFHTYDGYNNNFENTVDSYDLKLYYADASGTQSDPTTTNLFWKKFSSGTGNTDIDSNNNTDYWQRHFMLNIDSSSVGVNNRHYVIFGINHSCPCSGSCTSAGEWALLSFKIKIFTCAQSAVDFYENTSTDLGSGIATTPKLLFLNSNSYTANSIGNYSTGLQDNGIQIDARSAKGYFEPSSDSSYILSKCNLV